MGSFCSCCCFGKEKEPESLGFKTYEDRAKTWCFGCTDILFFAAFICGWILMISLLLAAIADGDPDKIIRGVDFEGRICGKSDGMGDFDKAAWPDYTQYNIMICVKDCNETQSNDFMIYKHTSEEFLWWCLPTATIEGGVEVDISLSGDFESASELATRAIGDMWTTWPVMLSAAFIAITMAFFYLWLMRKIARCFIWTILILLIIGGAVGTYALLKYAADAEDSAEPDRATGIKAIGYTLGVITLIFACVVLYLRKSIEIAIQVVIEASKSISDMKCLPFFPIFPFIFGVLFFLYWVVTAIYIMSVSDKSSSDLPPYFQYNSAWKSWNDANNRNGTYVDYEWDEGVQSTLAIHFFHLLWNVQFLIYFCYMVVAGAICHWYFTPYLEGNYSGKPRGDGENQLPDSAVCSSCKRTTRFHLGSIAFGSLIIAIIQFLRACVEYIERKTKSEEPNQIQKCIFRAIKCCLWCVECCMEKISKNAYVWMAIWGDGFLTSCCSSIFLILNNLSRTAAVSVVGDFLLGIGKILVALLTTAIAAIIVLAAYEDDVSSPVMPCVIVFILAFCVASVYMTTVETAIDTIFICFLVDEKYNKDSGMMLASPALLDIINAHSDASAKAAEVYAAKKARRKGQAVGEAIPMDDAGEAQQGAESKKGPVAEQGQQSSPPPAADDQADDQADDDAAAVKARILAANEDGAGDGGDK